MELDRIISLLEHGLDPTVGLVELYLALMLIVGHLRGSCQLHAKQSIVNLIQIVDECLAVGGHELQLVGGCLQNQAHLLVFSTLELLLLLRSQMGKLVAIITALLVIVIVVQVVVVSLHIIYLFSI